MRDYDARLETLEGTITLKRAPLCCVLFGDQDANVVVAQLRASRNWPDDGAHPVQIMRVRWGKIG